MMNSINILHCFLFATGTITFLLLFHASICKAQGTSGNQMQLRSQTNTLPQKTVCRFRGREYSPGDAWYPSSTIITGYCVSCTCLNSGRQNCTKLECPSDCDSINSNEGNNNNEHPCCKSCGENEKQDSENASNIRTRSGGGGALFTSDIPDSSAQSQGNGNGNEPGHKTQTQKSKSPFGHLGINNHESGEDMDDDEDEGVVTDNSDFISCLHQGKVYKDGDSFTANMSGLPIASLDQCMQCKCQTGMVVCHMDACSDFKCGPSGSALQGSSLDSDTCCQRCSARKDSNKIRKPDESRSTLMRKPPYASSSSGSSSNNNNGNRNSNVNNGQRIPGFMENGMFDSESAVAFRDVNNIRALGNMARDNNGVRKQATDDCISAGRFYMHSSVWHPIIGPFGTMECVVCKCNHGQIECNRLKCPSRRELACPKPVKVEGHCCPICSSQNGEQQHVNVEAGQVMCVPAKQDVTAFKSQGIGTNGSELIEFAFVRQRRTNPDTQVEEHMWTLRDGDIDEFTTQYLSTGQFDNLRNRQTFVLLGATNEKNIEKFTRREKKLEKRCFSKCSVRITSLERSLRLHRLILRTNCLAHERVAVTA